MDDWHFLLETLRGSWTRMGKPYRVTAAVSGGADSVALLRLLRDLSAEEGISLFAAHVDHGLRETSRRDAQFVETLCESLSVPCRVFRLNLSSASEEAAREARYEALFSACEAFQAPVLALAHHRRDQAETLLLRLFRGSGSGGLAGMAEERRQDQTLLWRPLLDISPDRLRAALSSRSYAYCEDETNGQSVYARNYLRNQVLPLISARFPQAEEAIGRAARILREEGDYFAKESKRFLSAPQNACLRGPCLWISYPALKGLHPALARHAVRAACPLPLDYGQTEALLALLPGEKTNLPQGWRAQCDLKYLHFLPPGDQKPSPIPGKLVLRESSLETGDGIRRQAMPPALLEQCVLRFRRPGDTIHPLGAKGAKSLQDYFVDKKVPQPFRDYVPLLCVQNRVVWAVGVGPGEEARVRPTDDRVLVSYEGYLPGEISFARK